MKIVLIPSDTRGFANHGWLQAKHSFSFANYYDRTRMKFGALRVLNDDIIQAGMGFGEHPHDNMEIITIPLVGKLKHTDSIGHTGTIEAGEVQVMSAGSGIFHSEFNGSSDQDLNLFQIWIFPDTSNIEPRYDQKQFDPSLWHNTIYTLVGPLDTPVPLGIRQNAWISRLSLDADKSKTYDLKALENGVYVMVISGSVTIAGQELSARDAIAITETDFVTIESMSDCELLFLDVPMG